MTILMHNIDDVRARIMVLESAAIFDDRAWQEVLADLRAAGRVSALADAERRMGTAKQNAQWVGGVDRASGEDQTVVWGYDGDARLKAYWVQHVDDDWGMFIHAASEGKAKYTYLQTYPFLDSPDFVDIRAARCRGADLLDMTPFTDDTLRLAGYPIPKPGDAMYDEHIPDGFLDDCPCPMCKLERSKPAYQRAGVAMETEMMA